MTTYQELKDKLSEKLSEEELKKIVLPEDLTEIEKDIVETENAFLYSNLMEKLRLSKRKLSDETLEKLFEKGMNNKDQGYKLLKWVFHIGEFKLTHFGSRLNELLEKFARGMNEKHAPDTLIAYAFGIGGMLRSKECYDIAKEVASYRLINGLVLDAAQQLIKMVDDPTYDAYEVK